MRVPFSLTAFLFFFFQLMGSSLPTAAQAFEGVVPDTTELRVLRQLYHATHGPQWTQHEHWLEGTTLAEAATWQGLQVYAGDVVSIRLADNNVSGSLPASLGLLARLHHLALSNNPTLTGSIPVTLGQTRLITLELDRCQFTGSIPPQLSNCPDLTFLSLSHNALTGTIPTELGVLPLQKLQLNNNQLSGSIPQALGQLASLGVLNLSHNELTGSLPSSLQHLTELAFCFLDHNQFSGSIPAELSQCRNLVQLFLSYNQLSGPVPAQLSTLPSLTHLAVSYNNLTAIPAWTNDLGFLLAQHNFLDFGSIQPNFRAPGQSYANQFDYNLQRSLPADTVRGLLGTSKTLHRSMKGTLNHYQWERQIGNTWVDVPGATDTTHIISPMTEAHAGLYRIRVWNEWVSTWGNYHILYTQPQYLAVLSQQPLAENLPVDTQLGYPVTATLAPAAFNSPLDSLYLNYVRSYNARVAVQHAPHLSRSTVDSVQVKTEYIDGLGRPIQTVLRQESPLRRDIVQPVAYDALGRQPKTYLPYTAANTAGSRGAYRANAIQEQYQFYHDTPANATAPSAGIARTGVPYAETAYEPSPLNRVVAQAAAGEAWQLSTDHVITLLERPNTTADAVQRYEAGYDNLAASVQPQGVYAAGELWVKETRDEQHARTIEFQNRQGQVVLKRVETSVPSKPQTWQWLETYYVFDDLNHLRAVLPPKAVAVLRAQQWRLTSTVENLLFRYRYDARGRVVAKQIPGTEGEVQMVYDQLDRAILSQDAAQRQRGQWAFTKYDALNRPVVTGLCTRTARQDSLQAEASRTLLQYEARTNAATSTQHYTLTQAYPQLTTNSLFTRAQVLTATYYDDYNFDNDPANQPDVAYDPQYDNQFASGQAPAPDNRVQGLITRTRVRVLGVAESAAGAWLTTTTFYNAQNQPIQIRSTNARGGEDVSTSQVDFAGKVLKSYALHSDPRSLPAPVAIAETFSYDHTGRLLTGSQQLTGETHPTTLATLRYNELGQLLQKNLGLGHQQIDYQYNIRGWLTHLNDAEQRDPNDLWGMELYYNHGFTRDYHQYNGNITGQKWRSKADSVTRAYGYIYDQSNRLLQGDFVARAATGSWTAEKQNYGLHHVSYDENGNILTLQRRGLLAAATRTTPKRYGTIDHLSYSYQGNRLTVVDDAIRTNGPATPGAPSLAGDFQDNLTSSPVEYTYDTNGNLTADRNKGITSITYNHLNLPRRIAFGNDSIVFRYTAAGQKVSKQVYQASKPVQQTDYAGSFQYEQDSLRFFPHAEGRVLRFVSRNDADQPQVRYTREYSLKDHLGNLRVAYRPGVPAVYTATMEPDPATTARHEEQQFDSVSIVSTRFQAGTAARTRSYVARLNAALGKPLGPVKMLHVQKGDTVRVLAPGMYQQDVRNVNYTFSLLSFVTSLIQQPNAPAGPESSRKLRPLPFLGLSLAVLPVLQQIGNVPKGYVRLLVFNKDSVLVSSRTQQLSSAAKNNYEPLRLHLVSPTDGYIQAYVGNDSDTDVFFDDVEVRYNPTLLVQENHYDPWGLNLAGIERSSGVLENKFTWNGKEKQRELNLDWIDHGWRFYDPQIGRWHATDPDAEEGNQESWSTYQFGFDNALRFNDLDGRMSDDRLGPNATAGPEHSGNHIRRYNETTTARNETSVSVTETKTNRYAETKSTTSTLNGSKSNISNISNHSARVIASSMRQAKLDAVRINSTQRTVREEATAMYNNAAVPGGIQKSYKLYASTGDKVVKTFEQGLKGGLTRQEIIENMIVTINTVGPTRVSKHIANPAITNVIDISASATGNKARPFNNALLSNPGVGRLFSPYTYSHPDPAFHVEIKQK